MASVIRGSDNFDSLIHQGLGVNQTWQDVTASRALGTTYTNTTGKPIMVSVRGDNYGLSAAALWMYINGALVSYHETYNSADGGSVTVVVPNMSTYSVTSQYSATFWSELR